MKTGTWRSMSVARRAEWLRTSRRLDNLAHNLAVAGALCGAFALGYDFGRDYAPSIRRGEPLSAWQPNVSGRPAP